MGMKREVHFCGCNFVELFGTGADIDKQELDNPHHAEPKTTTFENVLLPRKLDYVDDVFNPHCRVDTFVYQKRDSTGEPWLIKRAKKDPEELFNAKLGVCSVQLTSNFVLGLNLRHNKLYKVSLFSNSTISQGNEPSELSTCRIEIPDPSIRIVQIETDDVTFYGLDDSKTIYEISSRLERKWSVNCDKVQKFCCGFGHFVALSDTGAVYSWGFGGRGELGHGSSDHVMMKCESPKRLEFFDDLPCIVKDVCCGGWHTLTLTSDGDIYSWGWNESGQLGHSMGKVSVVGGIPFPVDLGDADNPITKIAAGSRHSVAILKSGQLFSWGWNEFGQLGVGDTENRLEPTLIPHELTKESQVFCGRWSTIIVTIS